MRGTIGVLIWKGWTGRGTKPATTAPWMESPEMDEDRTMHWVRLRETCCFRTVAALAAAICLAGCASVSEKAYREEYRARHEALLAPPGFVDTAERFDGDSTLNDYLEYAFAHSPMVRGAFDRWKAAIERIPQARALEDPVLSFEYFIEQNDERYRASLTQMLPAFGKLGLREMMAAAEAEAAMHDLEAMRFMVYDGVTKAFYEYHYLSRAIGVTADNLQLLAEIEAVAASRYRTGVAPFAELVKAQVEKDRIASELAALRDERGSKSALLAALLNLPRRDALPWPKFVPSAQSAIDETALAGSIRDLNPELKTLDSAVAAREWRVKLARKSFLPDATMGMGWMVRPGADGRGDDSGASLMAGMTVPLWWNKYRSEAREAEAAANAAANERDDRLNMLKADLSASVFKFHDAERRIRLFTESIVPKAAQALEVAKQEFSAGKTDFMTLVDAQRTLLDSMLMGERAAVDREIAIAEIGCCIGKYGGAVGTDGSAPALEK